MGTPRLTVHARERCSEMRIPTRRAKNVVLNRTTTYSGTHANGGIVCQSDDPDIAVVWNPDTNLIVTVLPRTSENYTRARDTERARAS